MLYMAAVDVDHMKWQHMIWCQFAGSNFDRTRIQLVVHFSHRLLKENTHDYILGQGACNGILCKLFNEQESSSHFMQSQSSKRDNGMEYFGFHNQCAEFAVDISKVSSVTENLMLAIFAASTGCINLFFPFDAVARDAGSFPPTKNGTQFGFEWQTIRKQHSDSSLHLYVP